MLASVAVRTQPQRRSEAAWATMKVSLTSRRGRTEGSSSVTSTCGEYRERRTYLLSTEAFYDRPAVGANWPRGGERARGVSTCESFPKYCDLRVCTREFRCQLVVRAAYVLNQVSLLQLSSFRSCPRLPHRKTIGNLGEGTHFWSNCFDRSTLSSCL